MFYYNDDHGGGMKGMKNEFHIKSGDQLPQKESLPYIYISKIEQIIRGEYNNIYEILSNMWLICENIFYMDLKLNLKNILFSN